MEKLNRNNADINEILNKKVGVVCPTEEIELDFRKWAKQYVNAIDDKYTYANCYSFCKTREDVCIFIRNDGTKWEFVECFKNSDYDIYEWGIVKEIKDAKPLTAEKKEILKSCLPQKTYTIRDIVDNKGKLYKDEYDTLYFYDDKLYCRTREEKKFRPSLLNLQQMLDLELTEYKEEPIKITFEEALKEMETKVYRSMFSNRCIIICGTQFIDASNGEHTKLALPEIKGEWVVIEE